MSLTSIGTQKTPGRPIELTFDAETGLPSANQELLLFGKKDATSGTAAVYELATINNAGDQVLGEQEANEKFGEGSELAKMVLAAIKANIGEGTVPAIKCIPLQSTDTDFGANDEALKAAQNVKAEYLVSPFDFQSDTANRDKIKDHATLVSGPQRVENNQFGSIAVGANLSETDPSQLFKFDTQYLCGIWHRSTGTGQDELSYSVAEVAAASAARMASNVAPFLPLDDVSIGSMPRSVKETDYPSKGAGLESESCLNQGWTPLFVKPNGEVAFVRTVTGRLSPDGTGAPLVTAYYDVQDFNVLYFWRRTLFTRFSQPDFKQRKASEDAAQNILSELIRLATLFEGQEMFQAVADLAKQFQVERNVQDRHRFDYKTPVNVIPGLHVIAGNIEATTQFDTITI